MSSTMQKNRIIRRKGNRPRKVHLSSLVISKRKRKNQKMKMKKKMMSNLLKNLKKRRSRLNQIEYREAVKTQRRKRIVMIKMRVRETMMMMKMMMRKERTMKRKRANYLNLKYFRRGLQEVNE